MVVYITDLPPELHCAILDQADEDSLQVTALSLSRALPYSHIPKYYFFRHIRLKQAQQVIRLESHLRKSPEDAAIVETFALWCWAVDADVFVNLLARLPKLCALTLFIGPNFAPEHLEDLFETPRLTLQRLSLRFRTYVQRPTYYQFLKGAYFDSTLLALSRWPRASLPTISVTQDTLNSTIAPSGFAQPLVFFRLEPLQTLARASYTSTVVNFRLRIPGREIAKYLALHSRSLPSVELLDLATSNVKQNDISQLMFRLRNLRYLILDGCPLVSQRADAPEAAGAEALSQWMSLGKTMACAGIDGTRARERKLKRWLEQNYIAAPQEQATEEQIQPRRVRRGRRGVATATISLRASPPKTTTRLPSQSGHVNNQTPIPRIRILPPVPALHSVTVTAPMISPNGPEFDTRKEAMRVAFEQGWAEGISMLQNQRAIMRTSWGRGMRVVQFAPPDITLWEDCRETEDDGEEGLEGLVDLQTGEEFDLLDERGPTLCFAGPDRGINHAAGCAHEVGWRVFKDNL